MNIRTSMPMSINMKMYSLHLDVQTSPNRSNEFEFILFKLFSGRNLKLRLRTVWFVSGGECNDISQCRAINTHVMRWRFVGRPFSLHFSLEFVSFGNLHEFFAEFLGRSFQEAKSETEPILMEWRRPIRMWCRIFPWTRPNSRKNVKCDRIRGRSRLKCQWVHGQLHSVPGFSSIVISYVKIWRKTIDNRIGIPQIKFALRLQNGKAWKLRIERWAATITGD